jgi:hypothetical protein
MPTPVTIHIVSDDTIPVAVAGVVVDFYNLSAVLQTGGTTDSSGNVTVSLPDGTYNVFMYKAGVIIIPKQPQQIVVDHTLPSNSFRVTAHIPSKPESVDPKRCTVSGHILGVDGLQAIHRLIFEPVKDLTIISGNVIAPLHRIEVTSDDNGYFEFDLLRNTKYNAYFLFPQDLFGKQPGKLDVQTPNGASANLADFLFPIPINVTFSVSSISLPVSAIWDISVIYAVMGSDGVSRNVTGTPWAGVAITNTDATIVDTRFEDGILMLLPKTPGTATISTVREIPSIVEFDPLPNFVSDTIVVTVTAS